MSTESQAPPARADVVGAYRNLLGRDPESEEVIQEHLRVAGTRQTMLKNIQQSREFRARLNWIRLFHYHAIFDLTEVINRHAVENLEPDPAVFTNYLGVKIAPHFFPALMPVRAGQIDDIPIPANWHADMAEWGAALRAVELAGSVFTVVELGCGWGCWINNTGLAARRLGKAVKLVGVEADAGHLDFAREACALNGFEPEQVTLVQGVAGARNGVALFPKGTAGENWGREPIFDADETFRAKAVAEGHYEELPVIALDQLVKPDHHRIDLLHLDIQGGEADLVRSCRSLLDEIVAYVVVGTHSREIEGRLFSDFLAAGWHLEVERPAILSLEQGKPVVTIDGVQAWRNPRLT